MPPPLNMPGAITISSTFAFSIRELTMLTDGLTDSNGVFTPEQDNKTNVEPAGADTGFFGVLGPPPPYGCLQYFVIFQPPNVNFPLPFKFHCRIQST